MNPGRTPVSKELWPEITDCYACSETNPSGIRLEGYEEADGSIVAEWSASDHHTGWPGIVHGGVVTTVLDEITGWAVTVAFRRRDGIDERPIVTAGYSVRFVAPVRVGDVMTLRAKVTDLGERKAKVEATIAAADGRPAAECAATYVRLDTPLPQRTDDDSSTHP